MDHLPIASESGCIDISVYRDLLNGGGTHHSAGGGTSIPPFCFLVQLTVTTVQAQNIHHRDLEGGDRGTRSEKFMIL